MVVLPCVLISATFSLPEDHHCWLLLLRDSVYEAWMPAAQRPQKDWNWWAFRLDVMTVVFAYFFFFFFCGSMPQVVYQCQIPIEQLTFMYKTCCTCCTCCMGAGWVRVTKTQPVPVPVCTCGIYPHGFTNP